jgi:hypothetical protein
MDIALYHKPGAVGYPLGFLDPRVGSIQAPHIRTNRECEGAKGVAKVATARKLAVRLYWMLRTETGYPEIVRIESSSRVPLVGASQTAGLIGRSRTPQGRDVRTAESWLLFRPNRWLVESKSTTA